MRTNRPPAAAVTFLVVLVVRSEYRYDVEGVIPYKPLKCQLIAIDGRSVDDDLWKWFCFPSIFRLSSAIHSDQVAPPSIHLDKTTIIILPLIRKMWI